jgi:hypothetical protein
MSTEESAAVEAPNAKKKPDVREYLEEKVFPILTRGLEELLRAVEDRERKLKESEEEDIPEVQPLLFLARYLMRNSPAKGGKVSPRSNASSQPGDVAPAPGAEPSADAAQPEGNAGA